MRYLPHTEAEVQSMLARVGVKRIEDLFEPIPASYRLQQPLKLDEQLDEVSLSRHLEALAERNTAAQALSFLGAGMTDHHVPPAVDQLLLRSEFYTAYTPYQAELSQGTLQAIFEFQSIVCALFGMDVSNASMYDGASAAAEAVLMARRLSGRTHVVVSQGVHPEYIDTVRAYLHGIDGEDIHLDVASVGADGTTNLDDVTRLVRNDTAAVLLGYPNFFGCVENLEAFRRIAESKGALLISATTEPYALSLLRSPGDLGVDIAVGEGQALSVPPQFGGPGVGLFACRQNHVQKMPGRLVGQTVDESGQVGYVLTLSTREQHIRRERATSNICTNHGLIALALVIRTSLLGQSGFEAAGNLCLSKTEYVKSALSRSGKFTLPYAAPTFNEFVVRSKAADAKTLVDEIAKQGVLAGVPLSRFFPERTHDLLIAVTEKHRKEDLDRLVELLLRS